ncbi:hypothetical protein EJ06DRAFT_9766 [Trichodelitschia bisporula]|uniref:Plasma membrane fusion protein PRM1 n=1 Tax=Trichodelitschia bisporula TaxID=703511 RepID=A0A6G1IA86_9PEZI|nr:hypothetical protein EJ06DRAFT_9766 [Trichodelitschia bisporula]
MAFVENRQQTLSAMPPPSSAGDHEMRDYYAGQDAPRPSPNQAPYLTPYLGLRARLSQVWINRWTILLLLVLVRTLLAIASTDNQLKSARREALSACTNVEKVGSAMASMPHYMSQGVNKMTATGITRAVNGLESVTELMVTGVEEIVVFYIGMLTNTYLCLTTFAVTGSLSSTLEGLQKAQDGLNNAIGTITSDISSTADTLQQGLNGLTSGVNTFTGGSLPKVDFSKPINELKNLKLPTDVTGDLQKLNSSMPTFVQVKNATETVIRFPFDELKKLINSTIGGYQFNTSVLPVPQKEALSFCSDNNGINDFFDGLLHVSHVARIVFIVVLLTLAIAICLPMAWLEIRRWRSLQQRAPLIAKHAVDPIDGIYMASRPYTSRLGIAVADRVHSPRAKLVARWAVAYSTSMPALFVLALGLAGLFACLCQFILLRALQKQVPGLTDQVANFTGAVVRKVDAASMQWANGTNAAIAAENARFNEEIFGWVNTSTTAVNATLNKFVDETMSLLNASFGGTPLYTPIKEVFNCLVGLKVAGIQSGLTWVHDNAHVSFPTLGNDTLSLTALSKNSDSTSDDNFLANPESASRDDISNAVLRVTDLIAAAIRQEAIISTCILLVWLIIVLIGIGRAIMMLSSQDKVRGEAGNEYNIPRGYNPTVPEHFGAEPKIPRPQSAAPPYVPREDVDPDVNTHSPYTLNPHPFPRKDDTRRESASSAWPFQRNLTGGAQHNNEKSGFI